VSFASMARRLAVAILLLLTAFAAAPTRAQDVPDAVVQEALIKEALITFNDANMTGNYDVLHKKSAAPFQQKFSPADLAEMFKGFGEQEIDIATVAGMDPIEDTPTAVANGVLTIKGHFATSPLQVNYGLDFIVEGDNWRLIGIDVSAKPVE
jgi:hypothetical protein